MENRKIRKKKQNHLTKSQSRNIGERQKKSPETELLCAREDSNFHTRKGTTPSKWRVYQFHHVRF
jgi:hypothetical protein